MQSNIKVTFPIDFLFLCHRETGWLIGLCYATACSCRLLPRNPASVQLEEIKVEWMPTLIVNGDCRAIFSYFHFDWKTKKEGFKLWVFVSTQGSVAFYFSVFKAYRNTYYKWNGGIMCFFSSTGFSLFVKFTFLDANYKRAQSADCKITRVCSP